MHRLGSSELMLGEALSLDEIVSRVDAVTSDDVARVVSRLFSSGPRTLAVVGPIDEAALSALG
jgi:predicted Zn-dependent peptidase